MGRIIKISASFVILAFFLNWFLFSAPNGTSETIRLVVSLNEKEGNSVSNNIDFLYDNGVIKNKSAFKLLNSIYGLGGELDPGAYVLAKNWNAFEVASALNSPQEVWVVIPEGLRKEEIAEILSDKLNWSEEEKGAWLNDYTAQDKDYVEGVYFPDTYLIPVNDEPEDLAQRLRARFEEKLAPYANNFVKENIKWTTALKVASLVQREAGSKQDMPVISGVIWNRLLQNMKLDIDATVQYARGDKGKGYWAPITTDDKKIDSPYNTYLYAGLPPTPITNPGINAIDASINPAKTKCLYYLHDEEGTIHCSVTYDEHLNNIEKYLR